jgi:hypothetical protein
MHVEEWLTEGISRLLAYCESHGLEPPYIICVASPNGRVLVTRVAPGCAETLAEHGTCDWLLPVSGILLYQTGRSLKLVVSEEGFGYEHVETITH